MKRILILVLMGFATSLLFAQDVIIKRNGDEIKSKVLEINQNTIKYKEFDFQDGPIRNISINDVFMIIYENGKRESFKKPVQQPAVAEIETENNNINTNPAKEQKEITKKRYNGSYFMLGTGYGNSYGGLGITIQQRAGGIVGVGYHIGVGYFPNAPVLASVGIKFYFFKGLYIDNQFGLTGWEEHYSYSSNGDYNYDSHLLYGPSALIGGDFTWGHKVGFGFNAGLGATYNINAVYFSTVTLALDLGFLIRF